MKHEAIITRTRRENDTTTTLFFTVNGAVLSYEAGQYIAIYEGSINRAYSLSSAPTDAEMAITVKAIGEMSRLLCAKKLGDTLTISAPFGFFNTSDDAPIVAIAAGVGVAPIWSIIRDELAKKTERSMTLHLTAPTRDELVFRSLIDELTHIHEGLQATYYVTREGDVTPHHPLNKPVLCRRFSVKDDINEYALAQARFYICGAEGFVRSIWTSLMEAGVDEQRVVTETFFEAH